MKVIIEKITAGMNWRAEKAKVKLPSVYLGC